MASRHLASDRPKATRFFHRASSRLSRVVGKAHARDARAVGGRRRAGAGAARALAAAPGAPRGARHEPAAAECHPARRAAHRRPLPCREARPAQGRRVRGAVPPRRPRRRLPISRGLRRDLGACEGGAAASRHRQHGLRARMYFMTRRRFRYFSLCAAGCRCAVAFENTGTHVECRGASGVVSSNKRIRAEVVIICT